MVTTNRRYTIRRSSAVKQIACAQCGEAMLRVEQSALFFGITQRRIFQIIETGAAHYAEGKAGEAMICLSSLAAALEGVPQNNVMFTTQ